MKKCISVLLCLILAFSSVSLFAVSASAAENILTVNATSNIPELFPGSSMEISSASGSDQVTVTYWYNTKNYCMLNCEFTLTYDRDYLEYDHTKNVNEKLNDRGNLVPLFVKNAFVKGEPKGIIFNTNPASFAEGNIGAIKANCTNTNGYDVCEGKSAFVSVTFNVKRNSGETNVNLQLKTMGFRKEGETTVNPVYLVSKSQIVKNSPVEYVTDKSYSVAYAGPYNEKYVPVVDNDKNLEISMNLELTVNLKTAFYVKKAAVGDMTDLRMNIKYSDDYSTVDKDLTNSEATVDGVEYYKFVYEGVNPQRMYDEYKVTVSANDNGIPHYRTETKGVKSYIYKALTDSKNQKWYTIFVDLLNYGSAGQTFKGYHDDELINSDLSKSPYVNIKALTNIVNVENAKLKSKIKVTNDYIREVNDDKFRKIDNPEAEYKGIQLVLGSVIAMKYHFNIADPAGKYVRVFHYDSNGNEVSVPVYIPAEEFLSENGHYAVMYKDLKANQMRDLVYFTVVDSEKKPIGSTTRFSIVSEYYIRKKQMENPGFLSDSDKEYVQELVAYEKAMMIYGDSVISYLKNNPD